MKTAIPDSINIKNHLSHPVKLRCFPPSLDNPKSQAHSPEDSPTASLCLPPLGAVRMLGVTLMLECHTDAGVSHCHLQSAAHAKAITHYHLTDNTQFILIFFLNTDESHIVYFSMPWSNMTFQTFNPCRKKRF